MGKDFMVDRETKLTLPQMVQRTVDRLIRAFAPDAILVFGSQAKGTAHAGSDVDLLIVMPTVGGEAQADACRRRARQLAADCFPPLDIVFATREEVAVAESGPSPFLASILCSATLIYQKLSAARTFASSDKES